MAWLPCDLAFVPQKLYNTIGQVALASKMIKFQAWFMAQAYNILYYSKADHY